MPNFQKLADYFENLCDNLQDAICITDAEGYCVLVNKRHNEITGIKKEDILGKRVQDLVDLGLFDTVINSRIVATGENVSEVQTLSDGKTIVLNGRPLKDKAGQVIYVVTILRDITTITNMRRELTRQNELLETFQQLNSLDKTELKSPLIMQSLSMQKLYAEVGAIAETDVTVLLLGETGVGKDVIARRIHLESKRCKAPFVKVDCGSIPENLIESELFGYAPGSFSGASRNGKAGLVEAASSGTLFLDEIGELPLAMQSRLLRVLQDFEVMRIGSTSPKSVDVRVIAATNRNLEEEVKANRFRSDLYYRLKVAVLHIPPLRERKADIRPLAQSFLNYYAARYNKHITLDPKAIECLKAHSWPGNVRELENMLQGIVATSKKAVIEPQDLPGIGKFKKNDSAKEQYCLPNIVDRSLKDIMKEVEQKILLQGLELYGSISEMAKHFGQDRSTIFRKVKEMEASGYKLPIQIRERKSPDD